MDNLIDKVAAELNIDPDIVEKAVRSQFKFVKDVMESGNMRSVMLPYFGKFAVKEGRLNNLPEDFLKNIHKSGKEIVDDRPEN